MLKRILIILLLSLLIFVVSTKSKVFTNIRETAEEKLVIPSRFYLSRLMLGMSGEEGYALRKGLKELSLEEKVKELEKENKILRRQLGSIPEKANLYPADVVWQTSSELMLYFPYETDVNLVGRPVVLENIFLGKVIRHGKKLLVVAKPTSSDFNSFGESENGVSGRIRGEFNERVFFEAPTETKLYKGETIYYLDRENGWKFLLGNIENIEDNERLPTRRASIRYSPGKSVLDVVFVVL